jgi:hypothetical protein
MKTIARKCLTLVIGIFAVVGCDGQKQDQLRSDVQRQEIDLRNQLQEKFTSLQEALKEYNWTKISKSTTSQFQSRLIGQILQEAIDIRKGDSEIREILLRHEVPAFEQLQTVDGTDCIEGIAYSKLAAFRERLGREREAELITMLLLKLSEKYDLPTDRWRGTFRLLQNCIISNVLEDVSPGIIITDIEDAQWFAARINETNHSFWVRFVHENGEWLFDGQQVRTVMPPVYEQEVVGTGQAKIEK